MPNTVNGVPIHVLLVHAVVVLLPLAALLAILGAVWPAARRRLGIVTPITALASVLFIPLTTSAGEWLQEHVPDSELVRRHVQLGDGLLVWAGLLFVLTTALWLTDTAPDRGWRLPAAAVSRATRVVGSVLLCAVAVVAVVQVYRIGDSGAKAAWDNRLVSSVPGSPD